MTEVTYAFASGFFFGLAFCYLTFIWRRPSHKKEEPRVIPGHVVGEVWRRNAR